MRIGVQLTGIDSKAADAISKHLSVKWDPAEVIVFRDTPAEGELDGVLLFGDGQAMPSAAAPLTDTVDVSGQPEDAAAAVDDMIFQVDAKLGRLTKSHLARQSTRSYLTQQSKFSRRELLTGARKGFRRYSAFPFVFDDNCEARLGCSKCLDACPTKALRVSNGSVTVSDKDCTMCGMCAAVCPVGAVQMPELSDAALIGMLDEIDESSAPRKTLVLTCDAKAVERRPWMVVEKVSGIGMVGPRQLAAAAASSLGGVAVVCPDGGCVGGDVAKTAVTAISGSIAGGPSAPFVVYVEGKDRIERLGELHESSKARPRRAPRNGDRWRDYVADLTALLSADSPTSGLGLTKLTVTDSCTLCGACAKACPHDSLRLDGSHLFFSASTCTGCGLCVATCPEHSVALAGASAKMSQVMQSERICEDELVMCARCGAPLGSAKFVSRVTSILGPDARLVNYCPACKKQVLVEKLFGGARDD